jgi:hypothetical protein
MEDASQLAAGFFTPRLSFCFRAFAVGALFVGQSFAAAVLPIAPPIPVYPQYRFTPASPTTLDSVSFWLVKGMNSSSCVPRYSTSFKIEQMAAECKMAPCPPVNVIKISYTQSLIQPLQGEIACLAVMTEYGPTFNFGKLPAGNYTIIDSTDGNRPLTALSVAVAPLGRSVTYTPQAPTARDSLYFHLFSVSLSCCTQIYNQNVQVFDTAIFLSYAYYNNPLIDCMCPVAGKTVELKTGPIKAGSYAVYDAPSIYCPPGTACPLLAILPQRVGQITVSPASGILPYVNALGPVPRFTWTARNGSITLRYRQALVSDVVAAIYNARGSMLKKMHMQKANAERYEAVWETGGQENASVMPGTYFVSINADGKTMSMEKISVLK